MKTIQILKLSIYILFTLLIVGVLGNLIISSLALLFDINILPINNLFGEKTPFSVKLLTVLKLLAVIIFCIGVFFLIKILRMRFFESFFENKAIHYLNISGKLIFFSGALSLCTSISIFFIKLRYLLYFNYDSKSLSILSIIIGLIFILFSKVLNRAKELKQENDLTI